VTTLMPREEFDELFDAVKNWGRWGDDDELGTLNHIGNPEILAACRIPRHGWRISLSKPLDTVEGVENDRPLMHYMTSSEDARDGGVEVHRDFLGLDFHGKGTSHLDALTHVAYNGLLYNSRKSAEVVDASGSRFGSVTTSARGIIARGVLLDVAACRGVDWIDPPCALKATELVEVATTLDVDVRRGDVLLIRSGAVRRSNQTGPWDVERDSVGLHPDAMRWLAEAEVSVLGGDGHSDARPSTVAEVELPIHILALAGLGMCLLDNLDLEALSEACRRSRSYEFLIVISPLVIPHGTGSPVNPIAVL
jgi:kynurenine formamidase